MPLLKKQKQKINNTNPIAGNLLDKIKHLFKKKFSLEKYYEYEENLKLCGIWRNALLKWTLHKASFSILNEYNKHWKQGIKWQTETSKKCMV